MSNASFSTRENFLEMDWENTQRTFEVTQFGAMHVCQHAARQMVVQGDPPEGTYKLVLISSVMAELSHLIPSSFGYNMAKASLDTLAKSLASGMAQHSITGAPARPPTASAAALAARGCLRCFRRRRRSQSSEAAAAWLSSAACPQ